MSSFLLTSPFSIEMLKKEDQDFLARSIAMRIVTPIAPPIPIKTATSIKFLDGISLKTKSKIHISTKTVAIKLNIRNKPFIIIFLLCDFFYCITTVLFISISYLLHEPGLQGFILYRKFGV